MKPMRPMMATSTPGMYGRALGNVAGGVKSMMANRAMPAAAPRAAAMASPNSAVVRGTGGGMSLSPRVNMRSAADGGAMMSYANGGKVMSRKPNGKPC